MADPAQTSTPRYKVPPTSLDGLQCNCPDLAVRRISHTSQNPERPFWCCRRGRDDPHHCKFFKWEDDISAIPATSGGPDSNKRPRSPASAAQESPRKRAILDALLSEEPETPLKCRASQPSVVALHEQLGDTHDDDELFHNGQVFKFDPYGGKERAHTPPSQTPAFANLHTTNGLMLGTPPQSASMKGKTKDRSLFASPESPLQNARSASASILGPSSPASSPFDHQPSFGRGQETDADDPAVYIGAVEKLDELPAYLRKLQRRVFEAETAKKATEIKLREYEERIRALQMENERLKAHRTF